MKKTAVIFNANDPQLPQAHLFIESLRDPDRGNYQGDIWVLSTELSPLAKKYVDKMQVRYFEDPLDFLWEWEGRDDAAEYTMCHENKNKSVIKTDKIITLEKNIKQKRELLMKNEKLLSSRTRPKTIPANMKSALRYLVERSYDYVTGRRKKKKDAEKEYLKDLIDEIDKLEKELAREESRQEKISLEKCFYKFRNKRCSKLIIVDFLKKYGTNYEKIIFCDTDILIQGPIEKIFEQIQDDKIYYWQEEFPILPGTHLWGKQLVYKKLFPDKAKNVDFGFHEINIGFLAGKPSVFQEVCNLQKELYLNEENVALISESWHEQYFYHFIRSQKPDWFSLFQEGLVIHLCNGGAMLMEERYPLNFYHKKTQQKPTVVHFAGGTWKPFNSLNRCYQTDPNNFFFYYLSKKSSAIDLSGV